MRGLMQDWPLLCHRIIEHAATVHGTQEVVTRSVEGPIHRTNYAEIRDRALKVSQRLDRDGIKLGDRVATIAWNTWRHLEAWYGIMGIGAICHTVNPRLFPDQIAWIINHAEDRVVMTDLTFIPILEKIAANLPSVERYIVFTDRAHMPQTTLKNAVAYEDWIAEADGDFKWKTFDENTAAAMCYTSGTTGDPKGVLYSHRSNVLHALMANTGDSLGANAGDTMLPVVPLFHANSWGIAFSAPSMGTKLVMPGAKLDGASVFELLDTEKVTHTASQLAEGFWKVRSQYVFVAPTGTLKECLDSAAKSPRHPFFISDCGDNPTAGGAGDVTWTLQQILARPEFKPAGGPALIYASIPGPDLVKTAIKAGVGGAIDGYAGAAVDHRYAPPVHLTGKVESIVYGDKDAEVETVIRVGSVHVIVTQKRKPYHKEIDFTRLGLEPRKAAIVVVKIGYLEPELYAMRADWLLALTPGGVDQDLERLPYKRIQRPMFPLDKNMPEPDLSAKSVPASDKF